MALIWRGVPSRRAARNALPRARRPTKACTRVLDDGRTAAGNGDGHGDNRSMTKAELHELVDRLPDGAVDGAAILLGEISNGRIDPEQAWFWTHEWQTKEREADEDLAAGRVTEGDKEFLAALDGRMKPLDTDT